MKTSIFFPPLIAVLFSCNFPQKQNENSNEAALIHPHPEVLANIRLNNGAKWKVDAKTNKSIIALQQLVELYEIEKNKDITGYSAVGNKLLSEVNVVIENCTMTGAEHDALNEWLLPFKETAEALSKADKSEEAAEFFEKLDAMLHKYYEIFE